MDAAACYSWQLLTVCNCLVTAMLFAGKLSSDAERLKKGTTKAVIDETNRKKGDGGT